MFATILASVELPPAPLSRLDEPKVADPMIKALQRLVATREGRDGTSQSVKG